jgi:2-amino-1-hydroxyethylphosphonate dioxygenase (glycine-forming)
MTAQEKTEQLFNILLTQGQSDYIGEPVSQLEHAVQAAQLAQRVNAPDEVVIAALFHDIGHMLESAETMGDYGNADHEALGAEYMKGFGFSDMVCSLVRGHVQAKRYLTYKHAAYYDKLSEASKQTLEYQGGRMTEAEAAAFEADPLFDWHLKMRAWDEQAKLEGQALPDFQQYKNISIKLLA